MHIHILGICGTFMGGLAALAREAGHRVTGCDAGVYPPMSDQLRALGIASARRSKRLPDVPTFQESGLQGIAFEYWQGIFLPKGASSELALFLSSEISEVIKDMGFVEQLENLGFEVAYKDYKQFPAFLREEDQSYRNLFKKTLF